MRVKIFLHIHGFVLYVRFVKNRHTTCVKINKIFAHYIIIRFIIYFNLLRTQRHRHSVPRGTLFFFVRPQLAGGYFLFMRAVCTFFFYTSYEPNGSKLPCHFRLQTFLHVFFFSSPLPPSSLKHSTRTFSVHTYIPTKCLISFFLLVEL